MEKNRQYFHDRPVLLFLAINAFLVLAITSSILLRLGGESSTGYIKEYRSHLGLDAFSSGTVADILSFIIFGFIIFTLQILISRKLFHMRRSMSLIVIFMTTVTLLFTLIISNALLSLR